MCSNAECNRPATTRGMCRTHYTAYRRKRIAEGQPIGELKICQLDICNRTYESKGLCRLHYERYKRHGTAFPEVPVKKTTVCMVASCNNVARRYGFCKEHVWDYANRDRHLKKKYGISLEIYNRLLEEQCNKCKICGLHTDEIKQQVRHFRYLVVDHCHKTGKIRGLLCNNCNRTLGFLGDNLQSAYKFISYLKFAGVD